MLFYFFRVFSLLFLNYIMIMMLIFDWKSYKISNFHTFECGFYTNNFMSSYSFEFLYIIFVFLLFDLEISLITPFFFFYSFSFKKMQYASWFLILLTMMLLYEVKLSVFNFQMLNKTINML